MAERGYRLIMAAIEDFLDNLYQTNFSSGEGPSETRTGSDPGFLDGDVFAGAHLGPFMEMGDQLSNPWPADVAVNPRPCPVALLMAASCAPLRVSGPPFFFFTLLL